MTDTWTHHNELCWYVDWYPPNLLPEYHIHRVYGQQQHDAEDGGDDGRPRELVGEDELSKFADPLGNG